MCDNQNVIISDDCGWDYLNGVLLRWIYSSWNVTLRNLSRIGYYVAQEH